MPPPSNHANHVLLAIPNAKVQGLRVGDIATDVLQTLKTVWVDGFGPFVVGSGRAKDANAITLELRERLTCPRCKSKTPMKGGICQNYGCESPKRGGALTPALLAPAPPTTEDAHDSPPHHPRSRQLRQE